MGSYFAPTWNQTFNEIGTFLSKQFSSDIIACDIRRRFLFIVWGLCSAHAHLIFDIVPFAVLPKFYALFFFINAAFFRRAPIRIGRNYKHRFFFSFGPFVQQAHQIYFMQWWLKNWSLESNCYQLDSLNISVETEKY